MIEKKRPKIKTSLNLKFESDIMKVLQKYKILKKRILLQKAKIFIEVDKAPYIQTEVYVL